MTRLTDTQLIVLSNAARREDKAAVALPRLNKAAAAKVGSSLAARKLMREIRSKPGMPVWREDEQGRRVNLIITRAGATRLASRTMEARLSRRLSPRTPIRNLKMRSVGPRAACLAPARNR